MNIRGKIFLNHQGQLTENEKSKRQNEYKATFAKIFKAEFGI